MKLIIALIFLGFSLSSFAENWNAERVPEGLGAILKNLNQLKISNIRLDDPNNELLRWDKASLEEDGLTGYLTEKLVASPYIGPVAAHPQKSTQIFGGCSIDDEKTVEPEKFVFQNCYLIFKTFWLSGSKNTYSSKGTISMSLNFIYVRDRVLNLDSILGNQVDVRLGVEE